MPARLRDLKRALGVFGVEVDEPGSGSHWKLSKPGLPPYRVPAPNGLRSEIDDIYVNALCRHFGIDRAALLAAM
jgi:hypothetical protein